ncbi:Ig-like domain-containing protein [Marinomonas sp. 2405UD68-3]|uniref:Ig-like domain-containing protein n=1 Tax=Marinomonas sp. 2405UD68-3 TaxID=3391835 RepID=UPI0039C96C1F
MSLSLVACDLDVAQDTQTDPDTTPEEPDTTPEEPDNEAGFTVNTNRLSLQLNDSFALTVTPAPSGSRSVAFESYNPDIVSVTNSGELTANSKGQTVIVVKHPDHEKYQVVSVYVATKKLSQIGYEISSKSPIPAGETISLKVTAIDEEGNEVSDDEINSIRWSGTLIPTQAEGGGFKLKSYTEGTFTVEGELSNQSLSFNVVFTDPEFTKLTISEYNTPSIIEFNTSYLIVQADLTNDTVEINPPATQCYSSDEKTLYIEETMTDLEDGFFMRAYATGNVTITCSLGELTDTFDIEITETLASSWLPDEVNSTEFLCGSYRCLINHINKLEDGAISAIAELPDDKFFPLINQFRMEQMTYQEPLQLPTDAIGKTATVSSPLSFSKGNNGMFYVSYKKPAYENDSGFNITTSQLVASKTSSSLSSSTLTPINPTYPKGSFLSEHMIVQLGDGFLEAAIYDLNGGEENADEEDGAYTSQFETSLLFDGNSALMPAITSLLGQKADRSYISLLSDISESNSTFGVQANSYFSINGASSLTQNFPFNAPPFGPSRSIDISRCNSTSSADVGKTIFIKQQHFPTPSTFLLCVTDTSIHSYQYNDSSSSPNDYVYSVSDTPDNWFSGSLSGLAYMGIDAISNSFGTSGTPSVMAYFGHDGSGDVKTHYGVNVENGIVTPIIAKSVIGIEGDPYIDNSILNINPELVFNYVATPSTRELWTPYGTLGIRQDLKSYKMNIGYAPFKTGVAIPFTYSSEGGKKLALLLFGVGDADVSQYGYIAIYNSDLARLPN